MQVDAMTAQIEASLGQIRIVLFEPEGPANIGSVARVMKNMGLQQLVLVNPQCDPKSEQARKMAVHAQDRLLNARQVNTLAAAVSGCQRAIATTARHHRHLPINAEPPTAVLPWLLTEEPTALIFGPESRGLSNQELSIAQRHLCIPTSTAYSALNLAQAVTICCYELRQIAATFAQNGNPPVATVPPETQAPRSAAPLDQLDAYCQDLEALLLKVGFLYPHTAKPRMLKLRRLLSHADPTPAEVAMLRGILRQIDWKISHNLDP